MIDRNADLVENHVLVDGHDALIVDALDHVLIDGIARPEELAGLGIRVNAVSPGFIDSAMTATINDKKRQELAKDIPVRRFGRDSEVAELVCFLCSPAVDYITGQVISIDGGLFMG